MSSKTKHSKIRNTGILFELLTRQITVDVLNNDKKGSAANILKEFFNKKTQLGKEYELYKVLTTENYKSEIKANHLVDAVVKAHQKLNGSQLKREKYNLIKEIKKNYDVNDFLWLEFQIIKSMLQFIKFLMLITTQTQLLKLKVSLQL